MERVQTVHRILFQDVKKDYTFMCAEVMWLVFTEQYNWKTGMPISYDGSYQNQGFCLPNKMLPEFTEYMKVEWRGISMRDRQRQTDNKTITFFSSPNDLPQILIWYLWKLYPKASRVYQIDAKHPKLKEFD